MGTICCKQHLVNNNLQMMGVNIVNRIYDEKELIPFPKDGIQLSSLNIFFNECGGKDKLEGLTTTEVNDNFLKPITSSCQLSYCQYLKQLDLSNRKAVGIASVFISHAWKYKFLDVCSALEWYFRDTPDIIIWFDLFSNNQHKAVDLNFDWWCNTFKSAIRDFGHTVMILAPWNDPVPLTRGWCLFELYCTVIMGAKFDIAMSKNHRDNFLNDLLLNPVRQIENMLATISVEKSECFKKEDLNAILSLVRSEVGFDKVNGMIFERLRDWMIEVTEAAVEAEESDHKRIDLMSALAGVYFQQGKFDKAHQFYETCFRKRLCILGPDSLDFLSTSSSLGLVCMSRGDYKNAESYLSGCYNARAKLLGERHPDTLKSMSNLAVLHTEQGRIQEAECLLKLCLARRREVLGDDDTETLNSMSNLAGIFVGDKKYIAGETLLVECLSRRKQKLGDKHPSTLSSINNLGSLYSSQEKYKLAEPLLVECLSKRVQVLGDKHPDSLSSMSALGVLYQSQGKHKLAEPLLQDCLNKRVRVLGDKHPDTLSSMNALGVLYQSQGKYKLAEPLLLMCCNTTSESDLRNLVVLYKSWGKLQKAADFHSKLLIAQHKQEILDNPRLAYVVPRRDTKKFLKLDANWNFNR